MLTKQVGVLSDWRRLNVMLTRERRGLVLVYESLNYECMSP